ncbi:PliI family lysozyme inhibitor of I-type lysozyme [Burkholderia multivorans]|uniref:PliI family lysozyme inhibitor of I-type lysozyme n=1 Tax=Burkholderia multivorans TaxID=87883 RepID=UPI002B24F983|nr:PliI family lysozyme inhibitor of I-type lysozyme [Burkholderia multivorans]MEB2489119.1 PliI family lysozyme inhibitor of I-type lysozyme [Burkholderia multivorans]MEB2571199.1 PliI family lysozyme inhibitor of I-type lysozyme [Burkholderia multivorans]
MKHRMRVLLSAVAFVAAHHAQAADDCSFVKKVALPVRQQTIVVSSGALEPCSTGSYAVRVYSTANTAPGFDTDDYVTGALHARDGTVTAAFVADLGARAPHALIVTTRSAGSGGYVGAQAYLTTSRAVTLVASVDGLAPDADVAAALRRALGARRGTH